MCGQLFHTGTPVVLWCDAGGYDAYAAKRRFATTLERESEADKQRYGLRAAPPEIAERVAERGWTLEDLRGVVKQFVLHYDVCGTSRQCFKVLEKRGLSVHFMLDVDGTIYQTLDLKERAWHASQANSASIGVEIAHIGAYPRPGYRTMNEWYEEDDHGPFVRFPKYVDHSDISSEFVPRPARAEVVEGVIHGRKHYQYDFTEEQYAALIKLCKTLNRVLPGIELDAPRDATGVVLNRALGNQELSDFAGVLGHFHVTTRKVDPGPAFDWERVLREARGEPMAPAASPR